MKIIIREAADADLDGIYAFIEKNNPRAAVEVISKKEEETKRLPAPAPQNGRRDTVLTRPGPLPGLGVKNCSEHRP